MTYVQIAEAARGKLGPVCKACPVCDGRACKNRIPGPGAKGAGDVAIRNHAAWSELRVNIDTLHAPFEADTSLELFGRSLSSPVLIGPVGDVKRHYGDAWEMDAYNECVLGAGAKAGTPSLIGDGLDPSILANGCKAIGSLDGWGIPTVKPWSMEVLEQKLAVANACNPVAIAMDVDAAGLPFLKGQQPPAGPKSATELSRIAEMCETPFIVKGIMTPAAAERAAAAGASAIVVSNHGGRVLDGVPSSAEVLPGIVDAVGRDLTILVDGGIRSGLDVFRALALGASAVLVVRPVVVCVYGAGMCGVVDYLGQLRSELAETMEMCGAARISDIDRDMLFRR